jgi:hypothetical protein
VEACEVKDCGRLAEIFGNFADHQNGVYRSWAICCRCARLRNKGIEPSWAALRRCATGEPE